LRGPGFRDRSSGSEEFSEEHHWDEEEEVKEELDADQGEWVAPEEEAEMGSEVSNSPRAAEELSLGGEWEWGEGDVLSISGEQKSENEGELNNEENWEMSEDLEEREWYE
jgi:hypothetical protein